MEGQEYRLLTDLSWAAEPPHGGYTMRGLQARYCSAILCKTTASCSRVTKPL